MIFGQINGNGKEKMSISKVCSREKFFKEYSNKQKFTNPYNPRSPRF